MLVEGIPADDVERSKLQAIMRSEFIRFFGYAVFDHIIDFSGYGTYVPTLFTLGYPHSNAKFYMWQHSDMLKDTSNQEKKLDRILRILSIVTRLEFFRR